MNVCVVGRYNSMDNKYGASRSRDDFEGFCRGLGAMTADRGDDLIVLCSNDHLLAQHLDAKFLFNQTADYFAMLGYIARLAELPAANHRSHLQLCCSNEMWGETPISFPEHARWWSGPLREWLVHPDSGLTVGQAFARGIVMRHPIDGSEAACILRSEMLAALIPSVIPELPVRVRVPTADLIILVGGGKATYQLGIFSDSHRAHHNCQIVTVPYFSGAAGNRATEDRRRASKHAGQLFDSGGTISVGEMLDETRNAIDAVVKLEKPSSDDAELNAFATLVKQLRRNS